MKRISTIAGAVAALLWGVVAFARVADAAIVDCTPTAGFTACKRITYSGADQTFTVPTGITSVQVKAWGAAGGGANLSFYQLQAGAAAGGYAAGTLAVSAGDALTVVVGQGGIPNSLVTTYGGGGAGGNSTAAVRRGGSGGGMSGVFAPGGKTLANARVIAGGGGGSSPGADAGTPGAGGGGGTTGGQDAVPTRSGRGGTQTAGGAAGTTNSACLVVATAGAALQGGNGGSSNGASSNEGGGGGGGGYYGGGGGVCQNSGNQNGYGGGGSSFTAGTGVTGGTTTAGANFIFNGANCAGTSTPGNSGDPQYTAGVGVGSCYGVGGNGEVVIQYRIATLRVTKTSIGGVGGFTFNGDNGFGVEALITATSGVAVNGSVRPLANSNTLTTLTETVPPGYKVTSINCTGLGAGTATPNLAAGSVELNAAAVANTNDVTCAFENTKLPTLQVNKTSVGGTGTFNFSGDNGFGTDVLDTAPGGTASGVVKILNNHNTPTTITEAIPSTYFVSGMNCTGLGVGAAVYDFTAGSIALDAAATAPGNTIVCAVTNTLANPALTMVKTANTPGPVSVGQVITYTFTVTNSGNVPISNVTINETAFNGNGTPQPTGGGEALLTDATPTGDSVDSISADGNWEAIGPGDVVTFTGTYTVTQADIDFLQ